MDKKVTYKEPKSYFSASMLKAAKDYDKEQAKKAAAEAKKTTAPKKTK